MRPDVLDDERHAVLPPPAPPNDVRHGRHAETVLDPRQGQLVELRFFGGLSIAETSEVMKLSPATIKREWSSARAWLRRELAAGESPS